MAPASSRLTAATAGVAALGALAFALLQRQSRKNSKGGKEAPVLCFGDSITQGYHGIWQHPTFGPRSGKANADELINILLHPYAWRLGALLATSAGAASDPAACDGITSLKFAEMHAFSGWTAEAIIYALSNPRSSSHPHYYPPPLHRRCCRACARCCAPARGAPSA